MKKEKEKIQELTEHMQVAFKDFSEVPGRKCVHNYSDRHETTPIMSC